MISRDTRATALAEPSVLGVAPECVVFSLAGTTYAVAAALMRACLSLPRLTALDETPDYLVGAFDLRGELAPVISPAVLGGWTLKPANVGDLVVVVDAGQHPLALHADAMLGIEPVYDRPWRVGERLLNLSKEVLLSGGSAWLIDPEAIRMVADPHLPSLHSADARLQDFERQLDAKALSRLEARAERYRGLIRPGRCTHPSRRL
ncbi:chemotaxis protein CheW [Halochromatium glycolicum]|nr:chemotaxis protein CheW [Halochromatium glycolicum]NBC47689.1 hypothetical protein [Gammaproteobacteria bacterium]